MSKSLVCLAVTGATIKENLISIEEYKGYIDLVELRADFLIDEEKKYLEKLPELTGFPVILTIRKKRDGGKYEGNEDERLALLKKGSGGKYAYIDLEEDLKDNNYNNSIKQNGATVIRSFHDFNGVPDDLTTRLNNMCLAPDEVPKAAVMPLCMKDLIQLLKTYKECRHEKKILLGMGVCGFPTRILTPLLGSYISYCSVPQKSAAPGHIDPITLTELYRFKKINNNTAVYGIIGNPVMHTLSPKIHNKGFSDIEMNAVYLPFHVDSVTDFITIAKILRIKGFSVTVPHKEEIIRYLHKTDKSVRQAAACNTVVRMNQNEDESGWFGVNSDGTGFWEPLKKTIGELHKRNCRATIIGAGGTAKTISYVLFKEGINVLILNRTEQKAEKLAKQYDFSWGGLNAEGFSRMQSFSDIIIQTTSRGMEPDIHGDPAPQYMFKGHEIVYDIVYKPEMTCFLQRAQRAGCRIIKGKEMLLGQAFVQFELFTGKEYPDKAGIRKLL